MNYGHMKTSQSVDRERIPKEARALFEYRLRAAIAADGYKEAFLTAVLDAMFPNFSNPIPKEREPEALRLMVNKLEPVERKMLIVNTKYIRLAVLSNRDMDCIEFVEYQVLPGILRRSVTYNNYNRAMEVFHLGTIRWKDVHAIPDVESLR